MRLFFKAKKGQYFVVAVVILITLAVTLVSSDLIGARERSEFDEVRSNFLTEAYVAINAASASEEDVPEAFFDYVMNFRTYASSRNIDFDLFYMLKHNNTITAMNLLGEDVEILGDDRVTLSDGESHEVEPQLNIDVLTEGRNYLFTFNEDETQLRATFEISAR